MAQPDEHVKADEHEKAEESEAVDGRGADDEADLEHPDTAGDGPADAEPAESGGGQSGVDESDADESDRDATTGDERGGDDAGGSDESDVDESDVEEQPQPLPALEPADLDDLLAAYHRRHLGDRLRLPWSWATLSPGERQAQAELLDGFVRSYNSMWAPTDAQTVPPCWHRHPAVAYDLATLAWAYYQAYVDAAATADMAMRFQDQLPRFADRLDRWLGDQRAECRAGRHTRAVRAHVVPPAGRTSTEDSDAVALLGTEQFGFPASAQAQVQPVVDHREPDLLTAAEEPAQQHP